MKYLDVLPVKLVGPVVVFVAAIITLLFSWNIGREPYRTLCNTLLSLMDVPSSWIRINICNLYPDWQYDLLYWWIIVSCWFFFFVCFLMWFLLIWSVVFMWADCNSLTTASTRLHEHFSSPFYRNQHVYVATDLFPFYFSTFESSFIKDVVYLQ